MDGQATDRTAAGRFVEALCASRCKVDIDPVGDHRASEFMDFDAAGRVVRSEAFYGR